MQFIVTRCGITCLFFHVAHFFKIFQVSVLLWGGGQESCIEITAYSIQHPEPRVHDPAFSFKIPEPSVQSPASRVQQSGILVWSIICASVAVR